MELTISARRVGVWLAVIIAVLLSLHLIGQISRFAFGHGSLFGFVPLFFMGGEVNIPAFYSSAAIFTCAVVLCIIAIARRKSAEPDHRYWFGLSIIFVFLSMDEALQFHERLMAPMHKLFGSSGIFHLAWTIPYGILAVMLAIAYLRFVWNLPARTRKLFIVAGLIYVGGALGMEILESFYVENHGWDNIAVIAMITIEDTMEMSGIALFLYALLSYISDHLNDLHIRVTN